VILSSVQSTVRTLVSKVIIPILNHSLKKGFPLPVFPAIDLQNADVRYDNGYILICSDVHYKGGYIKPSVRPPDELSLTVLLENDSLSGR
jgi:lipopolysaccharide-binding protein